MQADIDDRRFW